MSLRRTSNSTQLNKMPYMLNLKSHSTSSTQTTIPSSKLATIPNDSTTIMMTTIPSITIRPATPETEPPPTGTSTTANQYPLSALHDLHTRRINLEHLATQIQQHLLARLSTSHQLVLPLQDPLHALSTLATEHQALIDDTETLKAELQSYMALQRRAKKLSLKNKNMLKRVLAEHEAGMEGLREVVGWIEGLLFPRVGDGRC